MLRYILKIPWTWIKMKTIWILGIGFFIWFNLCTAISNLLLISFQQPPLLLIMEPGYSDICDIFNFFILIEILLDMWFARVLVNYLLTERRRWVEPLLVMNKPCQESEYDAGLHTLHLPTLFLFCFNAEVDFPRLLHLSVTLFAQPCLCLWTLLSLLFEIVFSILLRAVHVLWLEFFLAWQARVWVELPL